MRRVLLGLTLLCLGACAGIEPVAPWQKGLLAQPEMGFNGDGDSGFYNEHIYSSREAVSGGNRVGGGGCGCN